MIYILNEKNFIYNYTQNVYFKLNLFIKNKLKNNFNINFIENSLFYQ